MKLTIPRNTLAPVLKRATEFATKSTTQPALGCVHLSIVASQKGPRLRVQATDLDRAFSASVPIDEPETRGVVCVPAKELAAVVAGMPNGELELGAGRMDLVIRHGRSRTTLKTFEPNTFPTLPQTHEVKLYEVPAASLADAVERAGYAAGKDEARPALCAIYLGGSGDAVSTDGHRLAWVAVEGLPQMEALVPAASLREIARVAADCGGTVKVGTDATWLVCKAGDATVSVRLTDVAFVDYQRVVPTASAWCATFDREGLVKALERAGRLGDVTVRLRVDTAKGGALLDATAIDIGSGAGGEYLEEVDIEAQGDAPEAGVRLSLRLFDGAARAVVGDRIEIRGGGELEPVVLAAPGDEKNRHVVMPMRF